MQIKAVVPTFLKKSFKPAVELEDSQKIFVEAERIYPAERLLDNQKGHRLFELKHDAGMWWIFSDHWEMRDDIIQAPKPENVFDPTQRIDWKNNNQKISEYFTVREVTKGYSNRRPFSTTHIANILRLAQELDKVRTDWGSAIRVTSWYRPPAVNRAVGGATNSQHITGNAVDIRPVNGDIFEFQKWLDEHWFGALGYGASRGFVHLDMRNGKGWKDKGSTGLRWTY